MRGLSLKTLKSDKEALEKERQRLLQQANEAQMQALRIEGVLMYINDTLLAFEKLEQEKKAKSCVKESL